MCCKTCDKNATCRQSIDFPQPPSATRKEDNLVAAALQELSRRSGLSPEFIMSNLDNGVVEEALQNAEDFVYHFENKAGANMYPVNENLKPQRKISPIEAQRAKELAEKRALAADQRARTAELETKIENERADALQKEKATPIARFVRAIRLKNVDSVALNEWVKHTTSQERKAAAAEFETLVARCGMPLAAEDVEFARLFLAFLDTSTSPEQQATSFLSRMKVHQV